MPRDEWRNARKKKIIIDPPDGPYRTEEERTAYYKKNAAKIRAEHKAFRALQMEDRIARKESAVKVIEGKLARFRSMLKEADESMIYLTKIESLIEIDNF
jgi:hypothetical protein